MVLTTLLETYGSEMAIVRCNPISYMGIGRIVLVGRFIIECSPDGCTGTDLGLGLNIVVLPLNALMLKDNFDEGISMSGVI